MKILDRTKLYLKVAKTSQTALAKRLGIAPTAFNRLLRGKTKENTIALRLDAFLDEQNFYPEDSPSSTRQRGAQDGGTPA